MMEGSAARTGAAAARTGTAAIFFALLAIVHTWPMLPRAASAIAQSGGDDVLNAWQLTALLQRLLTHPFTPFDVNMYYPFTRALAGLDHQLSAVPLTAPVWLLTGNPLLVANLFAIATFALAGFLTFRLVAEITGSTGGALIAGSVYAFATMRFEDLGHTHLLGNCWLPLSLLTVHRFVRRPTWSRMWQMTGAFLLLALASWYLAVIGAIAVALVGLAELARERPPLRPVAGRALVGLLVVGVVLGSIARVYVAVTRDYVPRLPRASSVATAFERDDAPVIDRSADPHVMQALSAPVESYLATSPSGRLGWLTPWPDIDTPGGLRFFPGAVGVVLAIVGMGARQRARLAYLLLGAVGMLLSFGPDVHAFGARLGPGVYPADWPPFSLLRMPARFGVLFLLSTAVLAGFGYAALTRALGRPWSRRTMLAGALVLVNVELAAAPIPMRPVGRVPQAYLWLKHAPPGPVVEFPIHQNAEALYWSLYSGQPIANGFGVIEPEPFQRLKDFDYLSPEMLTHLRAYVQPRYIVINTAMFDALGDEHASVLAENLARAADQLKLVGHFGSRDVFEVGGPSRGSVVLRSYRPGMLEGKHAISVRARVDGEATRGPATLQIWGNGRLLATAPVEKLGQDHALTATLPEDAAGGLELEVMADYRRPPSAALPIGHTGRSIAADIHLLVTPERTRVEVNGHVWVGPKGYTVVAFDADGGVRDVRAFNTSWSEDASHALAAFLEAMPDGAAIAVASAFDVSRGLTPDAVAALSALGLTADLRERLGWAHAGIGVKGAPAGTALESAGASEAEVGIGAPMPLTVVVEDIRLE